MRCTPALVVALVVIALMPTAPAVGAVARAVATKPSRSSPQSAQIQQLRGEWLWRWREAAFPTTVRRLPDLSEDQLARAFLQDLSGHDMAAVMMSQNLLWRGAGPDEVVRLATSVRDDQHDDTLRLQRWLVRWFGAACHGAARGLTPNISETTG